MGVCAFIFIVTSSVALLPALEAIDDCFKVGGYIATALTTVDEYGALETSTIAPYAQYLKDMGADGVFVGGTTGEGPTLNLTDNKMLLDYWMNAAKPLNLFVIASVGGVPLPDTLALANYAEIIGVDALFILPDVFYKPKNAEELVYYMELIYQVAPNTPLVYDDNPQYTGVNVNMVRFYELAELRCPNFRGVKSNSIDNLILLRPLPSGQQKLFAANYFYLAPEVCLGFENFVLPEFNLFPSLIIDIVESGRCGNMTLSITLYQRLLDLIDGITKSDDKIAGEKEAFRIITCIDAGPVRPPLIPLSNYEIEEIIRNLQDFARRGYFKLADCNYNYKVCD